MESVLDRRDVQEFVGALRVPKAIADELLQAHSEASRVRDLAALYRAGQLPAQQFAERAARILLAEPQTRRAA